MVIPRLRMFAGPNGSGKSTIKSVIGPQLLGVYINPDDIQQNLEKNGYLDFSEYDTTSSSQEVTDFLNNSILLKKENLTSISSNLIYQDNKLYAPKNTVNAYLASVLSDFIRQKLLVTQKSFSFETDKVITRYHRSIALLADAIKRTHRAYVFDNSKHQPILLAEITNGKILELKSEQIPNWFSALLEKTL